MITERTIKAITRPTTGTSGARLARREGFIPAVVYGGSGKPLSISILYQEFQHILKSEHSVLTKPFNLQLDKKKPESILIRDVQFHPVTDKILSLDFMRVTPRTKTKVLVGVHFNDATTAPSIKLGGILNFLRHEVELVGPISAIPEILSLDIGDRQIGDVIRMSDFPLPKTVHPSIQDRDFTIASIMAPKIQSLTTEDVEEETTEEEKEEEA